MLPRSWCARVCSVYSLTLLVVLVPAAGRALGAPRRAATNRPLSAYDAAAIERARTDAMKRLRDPGCSRVLTEFRDPAGRTLAENLIPWGVSAADYLLLVAFRDGTELVRCRKASVEMVTTPGLPAVFVCPAGNRLNSRFAQVADPSLAQAMIIHEMLHTLGLGENPPSTFEITERVRHQCR